MKKSIRLLVYTILIFLPLLVFGLYWKANISVLTFVYTSDGHGHILPSGHYRGDTARKIGGMSALGGFLQTLKDGYLLVDSGDFFYGTPEGIIRGGSAVVELMNIMGYEAVCVGNHDFDLGKDVVSRLSGEADFPFINLNIKDSDTGAEPEYLQTEHVIRRNGIAIGFTGVITDRMPEQCVPENIEGLDFTDPLSVLPGVVSDLKKEGARIIAVLSQQDMEENISMAREVPGIDIIFSGHLHRIMDAPVKVGRTLIVQPGCNFENAGVLKIYYDNRTSRIVAFKNEIERLFTDKYSAYEPVEAEIDAIRSGDLAVMNEIIGECSVFLPSQYEKPYDKNGELALGNFETDIMRLSADTDFAFQNTGGIMSGLAPGKIMIRDIWQLSPFGNTLVKMTLKGVQIKELLEQSFSGDFPGLQVSGMNIVFNDGLPKGKRVLNVILRDEADQKYELIPEEEYTVVTNSFLAKGGDGYSVFKEGIDLEDTGIVMKDLLIEYVKEHSPVSAKLEKRLMNVNLR